ncbi:MAG TPA: hypothetical protein VL634_10185, partial [Mycobacterium sp.]|nr:hypothetical protein [Mycobacterium sp.]
MNAPRAFATAAVAVGALATACATSPGEAAVTTPPAAGVPHPAPAVIAAPKLNAVNVIAPTLSPVATPNRLLAAGVPTPVATPSSSVHPTSAGVTSDATPTSLFFAPSTFARTALAPSDSRSSVTVAPVGGVGIPGLFSPTGAFLGLVGPGGLLIGNGV